MTQWVRQWRWDWGEVGGGAVGKTVAVGLEGGRGSGAQWVRQWRWDWGEGAQGVRLWRWDWGEGVGGAVGKTVAVGLGGWGRGRSG